MLAYLCDRCPAKTEVVNGNLVLPQGWMRYEMEEGTGLMNNPKTQKHLCPRCTSGFKQAMREEPKGQLGQ